MDYYQPWLVLMTDGVPNGDYNELSRAIKRTAEMANQKSSLFFPLELARMLIWMCWYAFRRSAIP